MNGIVGKAPVIQRHRDTFLWGKSSSKRLAGRDFISSFISSKFLNCLQKQKEPVENNGFFCKMAERGGFEPPDRINRSTDFESAAFDHSATSPYLQCVAPFIGWRRCQQISPRFARSSSTPSLPHSTTLSPLHIHNVLFISSCAVVNQNFCFYDEKRRQAFFAFRDKTG